MSGTRHQTESIKALFVFDGFYYGAVCSGHFTGNGSVPYGFTGSRCAWWQFHASLVQPLLPVLLCGCRNANGASM